MMLVEFKTLTFRVAPELAAFPLYVLDQPASLPTPVAARAYVVRGPCAPLQLHLQKTKVWEGPGPAIVFLDPELPRDDALVAMLHEVAHLLPARPMAAANISAESIKVDHEAIAAWAANREAEPDKPRWAPGDHGKEFIRFALHCWWRAAMIGEVTDFTHLCGGRQYNLSPAFLYWRALGNEPVRMKDWAFDEILATDPPEAFQELWRADLAYWMRNHPEQVEK